jgi:ADP-ribose pyrophosphatase YjhB (NUDIX family)
METSRPEIQLISNIVVTREDGHILLVKYDNEDERWWLPGDDVVPYQHPDDRAKEILDGLTGLVWDGLEMVFVESFRGRRGWHVMFNYRATGKGAVNAQIPSEWFPLDAVPRTMHGKWEQGVIKQAARK